MPNQISLRRTGNWEVLLAAALLFCITVIIPTCFKTWFVEPTGNIKIAPFFGFLFGIGLLLGKQWARMGSTVLALGLAVLFILSIATDSSRPGYWLLLTLDGFLLYLLYTSRIKQYFQ